MALKVLFVLAVLKLAFSAPAPDPDPDSNIDISVQQVVNGCEGGCCSEECEHSCVYGFKTYEDGCTLDDVCLKLKCEKGNWKYLEEVYPKCGNCTVYGDPHTVTYESHTLNGGPPTPDQYRSPNGVDGEFSISQQGKSYDALFGVYANFTTCWNGASCVSRVTYTEPGINVELILPERERDLDDLDYCEKIALPYDPLCATKILVNDKERVIPDDGSVITFSGLDGTVLIFKSGKCTSAFCQIYVLGSKGITVSLLVEPKLFLNGDTSDPELYQLNIYPTPSLHNDHLYGLCDTFTGATVHDYTLRGDEPPMTTWSEANINEFVKSWNTKK